MKYSIAIPLNSEALYVAKECQKRLNELMGINSIMKNNSDPHINIISGTNINLDKIVSVIRKMKFSNKKYVNLLGLGVFLTPAPLLYLRFNKSPFVEKLRNTLMEQTLPLWQTLSPSVNEDIWTPKCTLAYYDLSLDKLSDALICLDGISFQIIMEIKELSIIDFTKKERQVDLISL